MGDATILPSLVKIDITSQPPSSSDIPYLKIWKNNWELLDFKKLMKNWRS